MSNCQPVCMTSTLAECISTVQAEYKKTMLPHAVRLPGIAAGHEHESKTFQETNTIRNYTSSSEISWQFRM